MGRVDLDFAANMRFGDGPALKAFALSHRLAHSQIAEAISSQLSIGESSFDVSDERAHAAWEVLMLDREAPAGPREALGAWLLLHANMHKSEYDALGFGVAYDLATVDMSDPEQFYVWMQQHQQIHDIEASALGITI